MSMPPVITCARPSATDSAPSVTISGGILALAIRKPLSRPQATPATSAARMPRPATPQPSPPTDCITLAATTEEKTRTDPMDRSMPEVMITKVMPTPSTAHTAMFCEISEKLLVDRNLSPAAMENATTMTRRTPRIHTDWRLASRFRYESLAGASGTACCPGAWPGGVMTLMLRSPSACRC
jgi:hypothetical protein